MIAGHNGAGKSTCYRVYLREAFEGKLDDHIDPDAIERTIRAEWEGEPLSDKEFSQEAQKEATRLRWMYLDNGANFSLETVFSDPVGDKVAFLAEARRRGYFVVLLAVGLESAEKSCERVALRVARGGHNVPRNDVLSRYPRVLKNFAAGVRVASLALVVDNSDDNIEGEAGAYYAIALFAEGELLQSVTDMPAWASEAGLPRR